MRYFKLKGSKTVYPADENVAILYERNGFAECGEDGKALPAEAADGAAPEGAEQTT
jgi:hypothetical protein